MEDERAGIAAAESAETRDSRDGVLNHRVGHAGGCEKEEAEDWVLRAVLRGHADLDVEIIRFEVILCVLCVSGDEALR